MIAGPDISTPHAGAEPPHHAGDEVPRIAGSPATASPAPDVPPLPGFAGRGAAALSGGEGLPASPPSLAPPSATPSATALPNAPLFLSTLLIHNFNLTAALHSLHLPTDQLLTLSSSPDFQSQLANLQSLLFTTARLQAIQTLQRLTATSDDPIEQRRAASAILRATNPSSPRGAGVPPASTPPTSPTPNAQCLMPNASPLRTSSPRALLTDLYNTFQDTDEDDEDEQDEALGLLHAALAPGATIDGHPVPPNPQDFAASFTNRRSLFGFVQVINTEELKTDTRHVERATFVEYEGRHCALRELILTRPDTASPWRIQSIATFEPDGPDDG